MTYQCASVTTYTPEVDSVSPGTGGALRANIDETVLPVIITEQGENRNQCEEQRYFLGFSHGFACR